MELIVGYLFIAILYFITGVFFAVPYCLLAGWSYEFFPIITFTAPFLLLFWFMMGTFAGVFSTWHGRRAPHSHWREAFNGNSPRSIPGTRWVFGVMTFLGLLPIIFRLFSIILGTFGYEALGSSLYFHRYASPIYLLLIIMLLFMIAAMVGIVVDAMKKNWMKLVHD